MRTVRGNCSQDEHFARIYRMTKGKCTQCGKIGHVSGMHWSIRRPGNMSLVVQNTNNSTVIDQMSIILAK